MFVATAVLLVSLIISVPSCFDSDSAVQRLTDANREAIVQAIEDEVYDHQYETHFADLGEPDGTGRHRLVVYVQPTTENQRGWVIYKLMPHGEVYRMFELRSDGMAVLHGDPRNGFPPTQPDYLTVYMDDDELCKLKSEWRRSYFVIDMQPSKERIQEATERQKKRKGVSLREAGSIRLQQKKSVNARKPQ